MRYVTNLIILLALFLVGLPLFMAMETFPRSRPQKFSLGENPMAKLEQETRINNGVVALISSFRPLETMGGLLAIVVSLIGVLSLTTQERKKNIEKAPYESSILSAITGMFFPFCLVFALYLMGYGFNAPGGGIQGGVMISAAAILFFLAFGHKQFKNCFYPQYFLLFASWSLILFVFGFLLITFMPSLASPAGILVLEVGLFGAVGAVLMSLFWALAQEE